MSVIKDGILGFAIGDALGVPIVFKKREELLDNPVTSIMDGGIYNMPSGVWSDDTSLTLATVDSIVKCNKIDYKDMIDRFCSFMNDSEYTTTGVTFDIDNTTKTSLNKYLIEHIDPVLCGGKSINDNNNGSLARMLPIALYCYYNNLKGNEIFNIVKNISSITHASDVSILGCYIYVNYLLFLLNGKDKFASYNMIKCLDYPLYFDSDIIEYYNRLLKTNIAKLRVSDLKSEDYIVYTLETVFWVILNCSSFAESVVGAINLGGDTDTIGAIVGGTAGIIYGLKDVPNKWLIAMKKLDYIENIINNFEKILGVHE